RVGRADPAERRGPVAGVDKVLPPVRPRAAGTVTPHELEGRVVGQSHLPAGIDGLLGLPLADRTLDRDGLDAREGALAAQGLDGLAHETVTSRRGGRA